MRPDVLAPAAAVLLTILAGCPAELPLSGSGSAEDQQPESPSSEAEQPAAPAPPPPPPPAPGPPPSPQQLARQALQSPSSGEQEAAAVRLAQLGKPAKEHLRRVLSESRSPGVRAGCIQGLAAQWDYESVPAMLDALDDESELVRGRAGMALGRMMSVDYGYRADDPPQKRADSARRLREQWERFRDSETLENWKKRLEERERRENTEKRP